MTSIMLDFTGQDLAGFNPDQVGYPLPEVGTYNNLTFTIKGIEPSETKNREMKLDVYFEIHTSDLKGKIIKLSYNVGHSQPQASLIARQGMIRLIKAITGIDYTGKNFPLDEKVLYNKPFLATLEVSYQVNKTTKEPVCNDKGIPFKQANLTHLEFISNNVVGNPQTQTGYVGQPQTYENQNNSSKPNWSR